MEKGKEKNDIDGVLNAFWEFVVIMTMNVYH